MKERRAHPRYPTREFGILREVERGMEVREQVVYVVNVSAFGAGLELDRPIAIGTAVKLYVGDCTFSGTIVHCRKDGSVYGAGIAVSCGSAEFADLLNQALRRQRTTRG